jgi:hypothetical protein
MFLAPAGAFLLPCSHKILPSVVVRLLRRSRRSRLDARQASTGSYPAKARAFRGSSRMASSTSPVARSSNTASARRHQVARLWLPVATPMARTPSDWPHVTSLGVSPMMTMSRRAELDAVCCRARSTATAGRPSRRSQSEPNAPTRKPSGCRPTPASGWRPRDVAGQQAEQRRHRRAASSSRAARMHARQHVRPVAGCASSYSAPAGTTPTAAAGR